jgi:hypothetical protein
MLNKILNRILNRIKTKPGYKVLGFILLVIAPFYLVGLMDQAEIDKIKNNPKIEVQCNIRDKGWVTIDKSKIIGIDDNGGFIFTNGYAKNCEVING